eukprot:14114320-Heterocapsa_arctica.AAC.1
MWSSVQKLPSDAAMSGRRPTGCSGKKCCATAVASSTRRRTAATGHAMSGQLHPCLRSFPRAR